LRPLGLSGYPSIHCHRLCQPLAIERTIGTGSDHLRCEEGEREVTKATPASQALCQPSHSLHHARPQPPLSNPVASSQIQSPDADHRHQIRPPTLRGGGGGRGSYQGHPGLPGALPASPRTASTARARSHHHRIRPPGAAINAKHELAVWPSQPSMSPLQVANPDRIRMPTIHLMSIGCRP
jgi:hypothetical protein